MRQMLSENMTEQARLRLRQAEEELIRYLCGRDLDFEYYRRLAKDLKAARAALLRQSRVGE